MIGKRLAHYQVLELLGRGGMGAVYRARDTRLHRDVALKLLSDPSPRAANRLRGEARSLAALSHPNVAAIHGLEEVEGVMFLVLEFVQGDTLQTRVLDGSLGIVESLRIGIQIASALEAAHGRGLVHRDLKPANVMIRDDGIVKVLDLGLAQALAPAQLDVTLTASTPAGAIHGTPAYMSPEQARGAEVDARADLWSLGCVLYEMLCGRRAFEGSAPVEVLAAVLDRDPDWMALPADVPAAAHRLLSDCLRKPREDRPASATAARKILEVALDEISGARPPSPPTPHLAQVTFAAVLEENPTWSPNGTELVFCRQMGPVRKLFRQGLENGDARQVTRGEQDDLQPVWSPDGDSILFVRARASGSKLEPGDVFGSYTEPADVWQIDLSSGQETLIIENAYHPCVHPGGKSIAVDASWAGPRRIWTVDRRGRNPQQITSDTSEAVAHIRPRWSPDGAKIVFQNLERTQFDIRVVDVSSRALHWLTRDLLQDFHPAWSPSGRYVYFTSAYRSGGLNLWRVPVAPDGSANGPLQQITNGAGKDVDPVISPDGRRLAFCILRQNAEIWRLPVDPRTGDVTGSVEPLVATTREDSRGAWSPDDTKVAFNSDRAGSMNLWVLDTRDGSTRPVTRGPGGDYQPNWSPDGQTLAFFSSRNGNPGIWTVGLDGSGLTCLSPADRIEVNPCYSPDGARIAYQSDRDGRLEVWVMNADGSEARQLTRVGVGGHFLRWTLDGKHVVFRCPSLGRSLRVSLEADEPEPLPEVVGGSHTTFSPSGSLALDVLAHKILWISPLDGGTPREIFAFEDPDVRIDYPVWSNRGDWVLFDRFRPAGGDIWVMEGFEEGLGS